MEDKITILNENTGEVILSGISIDEALCNPRFQKLPEKMRNGFCRWAAMRSGAGGIINELKLGRVDLNVLFVLTDKLDFGNKIVIQHKKVAQELKKPSPNISRAITNLIKVGLLIRKRRDKRGVHYMLNPDLFWKGYGRDHRQAIYYFRREQLRIGVTGDVRSPSKPMIDEAQGKDASQYAVCPIEEPIAKGTGLQSSTEPEPWIEPESKPWFESSPIPEPWFDIELESEPEAEPGLATQSELENNPGSKLNSSASCAINSDDIKQQSENNRIDCYTQRLCHHNPDGQHHESRSNLGIPSTRNPNSQKQKEVLILWQREKKSPLKTNRNSARPRKTGCINSITKRTTVKSTSSSTQKPGAG